MPSQGKLIFNFTLLKYVCRIVNTAGRFTCRWKVTVWDERPELCPVLCVPPRCARSLRWGTSCAGRCLSSGRPELHRLGQPLGAGSGRFPTQATRPAAPGPASARAGPGKPVIPPVPDPVARGRR